jgi:hypothetical protein
LKEEADEQEVEVASMDDPVRFGPVLHRLSFAEAVDRRLLSDYRVLVIGATDDEAQALAETGAFVAPDPNLVTDARSLARSIGLLKAVREYGLRRVISFHGRIKRAREFVALLEYVTGALPTTPIRKGELYATHISGEMTAGVRRRLLTRLKNLEDTDRMLLANARCLTEGVDVPALDAVAFIDPRSSQIDIVQAVGRAMRQAPDKETGTIVIPVFLREADDPDTALDSSEFRPVWQIVNALRSHDESLNEEIDALCRGLGRTGRVERHPGKLVLNLPRPVDLERFSRAFDARLVTRTGSSFALGLGALEEYVRRHGDARVPQAYKTKTGFKLGIWCGGRRQENGRGALAADRVAALDALGFIWHPHEDDWQQGLIALEEYVEQYGDARVPINHKTKTGFKLGTWCGSRRQENRRGALAADRVAALDALGFIWHLYEDDWQQGLMALEEFVRRHGNAHVPQDYATETGFKLGLWCNNRRQFRKRGTLPVERIAALEALGLIWDPLEDSWLQGMAALRDYVQLHASGRVPVDYQSEEGFKLGAWCHRKRQQRKRGKLAAERIDALDELGFVWSLLDDTWEQGYDGLQEFIRQHGHADISRSHVTETGFKLGIWCDNRRQQRRRGKLAADRVAALDAPGFPWDPSEDEWQRGLAALEDFIGRHGTARVPVNYRTETGFKLGLWCTNRRQQRKHRKLRAARIAALDELGFPWQLRSQSVRSP